MKPYLVERKNRFICHPDGRDGNISRTQSGALSLVGIVEIVLSLVERFTELKYFHDVATPALSLVLYGIRDSWLPLTGKVLL